MNFTRRDCLVAAFAVVITLGCVKLTNSFPSAAQEKPIPQMMTSSVFNWEKMVAKPSKAGATRQVFQNPTPTLDELECHITTLNPGASPHEPHKHVDEELILVKEGTVESLVNGERRKAGPGSVIFQSSNQLHAIRNIGDTPATYFVVKWNSPGMMRPLTNWNPPQKK